MTNLLLQAKEIADSLLLSDAADFGTSLVLHAKKNLLKKPFRKARDLTGAFQNIPAILVGAGPSLEKNGHLLSSFQDKAIIFAGGHALEKIPCAPHFGACIDKARPIAKTLYPNVPLCFQARMHPDNFDLFQGEAILAPDSHFSFLNFLSNDEENPLFDGGWTVGNFLVRLAVLFGCNPIVCVGMDYCYQEGRKYAFSEETSPAEPQDWLMAVHWMGGFAQQHPDKTFLNATEGGIPYFSQIALKNLELKKIPDLQGRIDRALANAFEFSSSSRFSEWEQNLLTQDAVLENQLLAPLWRVWKPIFERENFSNMDLHQKIFFQRIIQEHLSVLG